MTAAPLLEHELALPGGGARKLSDYRGDVLLVVNTASECGFTKQYAGLEELQREYGPRGLRVLGFPCNQFGGQEPGSDAQIARFCEQSFGVSFELFAKTDVKGPHAPAFFRELQEHGRGQPIRWNFTKFLIGRDGELIDSWKPFRRPTGRSLRRAIERALAEPAG